MYLIDADEVSLGEGVIIEDGVRICGKSSPRARRIKIGDNSFIGRHSVIAVDDFEVGDYVVVHNHALITGDKPCRIGHCCWFGQNTILNCAGSLTIGRGVGVGAYSQLWTHIAHGDTLQGCRWNSTKPLMVGDDVWFVGHCIVAPITAHERSMALVGSVVTKDMEANHIYAGVPAQDVTNKMGTQFEPVPLDEKRERLTRLLERFYAMHPQFNREEIEILSSWEEARGKGVTAFNVATRTYTKRLTPVEVAFMKFLLPTVKFYPQ